MAVFYFVRASAAKKCARPIAGTRLEHRGDVETGGAQRGDEPEGQGDERSEKDRKARTRRSRLMSNLMGRGMGS